MKNILTIGLLSAFVMGCSTVPTMSLNDRDVAFSQFVTNENLASVDKITSFKFTKWKSLSDSYLIVTAAHKRDYLINTRDKCYDLNNAKSIQLNLTSDSTINIESDSISTSGVQRCFIESIYPISNEQSSYLANIGKSNSSVSDSQNSE